LSLLGDAAGWLQNSLETAAGETVTYSRAGEDDITLVAVPGATTIELIAEDGSALRGKVRDFIINPADLVLSNEPVAPERLDRITRSNGEVYEVLPHAGENVYRPADQYGKMFRVHAKLLSEGN